MADSAFGVVHRFPGGTKEQYEAARAAVHPPDGLPEGQIVHIAGSTDDGWIVVALHESRESYERFRDETLNPGLQSAEGAFTTAPQETQFEVHNLEQSSS